MAIPHITFSKASATFASRAAAALGIRAGGGIRLLSPAGTVGDDGEDSLETVMQQVAVALSGGGGVRIPF